MYIFDNTEAELRLKWTPNSLILASDGKCFIRSKRCS